MSSNTDNMDWDVEEYRTEHECDEHWQLRRMFLLKHKDKFSEDRLICLAQVFINVEILGCRYPEETMQLVASLSAGIIESFREKRKTKLKRTFVQASDAAESKAKGTKRPIKSERNAANPSNESSKYVKPISFQQASDSQSEAVPGPSSVVTHELVTEISCVPAFASPTAAWSKATGFRRSAGIHTPNAKPGDMIPVKPLASHRIKKTVDVTSKLNQDMKECKIVKTIPKDNPFGNLIILENRFHESPASATIQRSFQLSGMSVEDLFKCRTLPNGNILCEFNLNGKVFATAEGTTRLAARDALAEAVLKEIKEFCYTIEIKASYISETTIDKSFQGKGPGNNEQALSEDNLGNKLMRLMGWSGGGLGKNSQGIETPIAASDHINRAGLGLANLNINQSKNKIRKVFHSFIANDSGYDLAFSSDFTKEERAVIHLIASQCKLRTKSYGIGDDRHIVVSKKERPYDILHRLIQSGGSTEKYNLIKPKRLM